MGIAEELAAQKAAFVSLREVLETLAASEACDIGTAAQWLARTLAQAPSADRPGWHGFQPHTGMVKCGLDAARPGLLLSLLAKNGKPEIDPDDIPF